MPIVEGDETLTSHHRELDLALEIPRSCRAGNVWACPCRCTAQTGVRLHPIVFPGIREQDDWKFGTYRSHA